MFGWAWVFGIALGLAVSVVSMFIGAWVYRQDHPVPIGIFGLVMYLFGVVTIVTAHSLM